MEKKPQEDLIRKVHLFNFTIGEKKKISGRLAFLLLSWYIFFYSF